MRDSGAKKKQKRTEDYGISFKPLPDLKESPRFAFGWAFGVRDAFRDQLDIRRVQFVDKKKNDEKKKKLKIRVLPAKLKAYRWSWTRGTPPMLTFGKGQIFYDPPQAHVLPWAKALGELRRAVQIIDATPDAPAAAGENRKPGWVKFSVVQFKDGKELSRLEHTTSQSDFADFLRLGHMLQVSEIQIPIGSKKTARKPKKTSTGQLTLL
ncbi:MAG: hypothetical protein AB7E79_03455 [Rhodospirillaceae bacterium]